MSAWRKSSFCTEDERAKVTSFRKSSHCTTSECAEAGHGPGIIAVRDSELGAASPVLEFSTGAWRSFTAAVKKQP